MTCIGGFTEQNPCSLVGCGDEELEQHPSCQLCFSFKGIGTSREEDDLFRLGGVEEPVRAPMYLD